MLPCIWTKCMELILPLDEKRNNEEKQRKKKNTRIRYSTLTIFITTVTLNGTTIGDKLVETLYSNRVTSENKINYTPPLHSKETTPLPSIQSWSVCCFLQVAPTAAQHCKEGMGKEKLYYTLLKLVNVKKPLSGEVSQLILSPHCMGG